MKKKRTAAAAATKKRNNNATIDRNNVELLKHKRLTNLFIEKARINDREAVQQLLTSNPKLLEAREHSENTPTALIVAASMGHTDMVNLLLSLGANVNSTTKKGYTAAQCALYYKHKQIVRILEDFQKQDPVFQSIFQAIFTNDIETMTNLIGKHKECIDAHNKRHTNMTPLIYACYLGRDDIAKLLVLSGGSTLRKDLNSLKAIDYVHADTHKELYNALKEAQEKEECARLSHHAPGLLYQYSIVTDEYKTKEKTALAPLPSPF